MKHKVKLEDGKSVDISFSMYFLNRVCKMTALTLQDVFTYLIGNDLNIQAGSVSGGLLDDLEVRAVVLAAGMEAESFAKGNYKKFDIKDGFDLLENVEGGLQSTQWADIYTELIKSLVAEKLPKDDAPKKKAGAKK